MKKLNAFMEEWGDLVFEYGIKYSDDDFPLDDRFEPMARAIERQGVWWHMPKGIQNYVVMSDRAMMIMEKAFQNLALTE